MLLLITSTLFLRLWWREQPKSIKSGYGVCAKRIDPITESDDNTSREKQHVLA